jgi:hypothetical protein
MSQIYIFSLHMHTKNCIWGYYFISSCLSVNGHPLHVPDLICWRCFKNISKNRLYANRQPHLHAIENDIWVDEQICIRENLKPG